MLEKLRSTLSDKYKRMAYRSGRGKYRRLEVQNAVDLSQARHPATARSIHREQTPMESIDYRTMEL